MVDLDEPYLVDVGLGDGPSEPIPLREGSYRQGWRTVGLERLDDGWWRFHNYTKALVSSFDFQHRPADWNLLMERCEWLQTSPESYFRLNAVCIRHQPDGIVALVGRILKAVNENGVTDQLLRSAEDYAAMLTGSFGIRLPQAIDLWPRILQRHEALFGQAAAQPQDQQR
jgi:N-hydroxyarylamine O-acetyltransferase